MTEYRKPGTRASRGRGLKDSHGHGLQYIGGAGCLLIVGALLTMMVTTYNHKHAELPTLKMSIPNKANIRHIRSYSVDPSITDVQVNNKDGEASFITRLQLLDLSSPECGDNLTQCRTHALCDTNADSGNGIKCRCNQGYYLKDLTCTACTTSCEDGFYMEKQCTAEADRVCKPCTQCEGSSYAVAPCTSTQDTLCIDVTFPMKQFLARGASVEELVSLNVSMSKNVFLEHLHNIKKLETPLYMSNNRQEMQFVWYRASGLKIKIKVSDIYLIPEYIDIDHVDDRNFIEKHSGYPQKIRDQILDVMDNNCRHPLPDQYDLILQLARSVATVASEVTCDSQSSRPPTCPEGLKDGDRYISGQLDKHCPRMRQGRVFNRRTNNILCSGNTEMLNKIFNMTVMNTETLTFPDSECQSHQRVCDSCLKDKACIWGSNDTDCCNRECLSKTSCKTLYSSECPPPQVECIRGDISKFSIMPRFPSIERQFACHLRYQTPKLLYLVSYEVSIPSLQFTLGERRKEVMYKNISDYLDGRDSTDFLKMSHRAVKQYDDEVILVGQFDPVNKDQVKNYTLHKLKPPWAFDRVGRRYQTESKPRANRTTAKIQFIKPFLYSTFTWHNDGCDKKVFNMVPSQLIYELYGLQVVEPDKREKGGRFVYQLKSSGAVSLIKLLVPENISILSYYKDSYISRLMPISLSGKIGWNSEEEVWVVTVSGSITRCPGYFTVELYSDNSTSLLGLYDMLINCPRHFSIEFSIQRSSIQLSDLFVVIVNDSVASYRIVLTSIQGPQFFKASQDKLVSMDTSRQSPWIPIIVIVTITLVAVCVLCGVYIYIDRKKSKHMNMDLKVPKPDLGPQITLLDHMDSLKVDPMTTHTKVLIGVLVALYVTYAILFTFTALFCMLYIVQGHSISEMTIVSNTSDKIQVEMQSMLRQVVEKENAELKRQVKGVQDRLSACSSHMKSSVSKAIPDMNDEMFLTLMNIFRDKGTVHKMLHKYYAGEKERYQQEISKFVEEFNRTLDRNLHKVRTTYTSYLTEVAQNEWFSFPRKIFMEQQRKFHGVRLNKVTDDLAGFLKWLEIDKVQETIEIKEVLMDKMLSMMPTIDFTELLDGADESAKITTSSLNFTVPESTFKFMSGPPPGYRSKRLSRDKYFEQLNSDGDIKEQPKRVKSVITMLFTAFLAVFICLDILLCVYRFSWLRKSFTKFKNGLEHKVPYDSIARTIHFFLTGKDMPKEEHFLDHPYDLYLANNKDNIWGDKPEQYFLYCQAPSQKEKEEILNSMIQGKQSQKPLPELEEKPTGCQPKLLCIKLVKLAYRFAISPAFWRFILICGFVLFLCMVAKAIDDLVTMESAVFLMDTEVMMPVLARQSAMSEAVMRQHADYLNKFLVNYKQVLDSEVQSLNSVLLEVTERQLLLLNTLISEMCNLAGMETCDSGINLVSLSLSSCNFLPLHAQPYVGINEDNLSEFIKAELFPLVVNLRNIFFTVLYLLLVFSALMLVCQLCARVIYVRLRKSCHLRTTNIYQMPCTSLDPWQPDPQFPKDVYNSHSVIAESCESGVYDMAPDQT